MDHCEENMSSVDEFASISDSAAGVVTRNILQAFYDVVRGTTQRRHKRRPTMCQVCVCVAAIKTALNHLKTGFYTGS